MPAAAVDEVARVKVDAPEPGAAMDAEENAAVTPAGNPDALRLMAELKPPETAVVIALVPWAPGMTATDVGDAVSVNAGAVTVRLTDAV